MIRALDRSVGRINAALEEEGLADNTIVLFTSDNGGPGYLGLPEVNHSFRGWKISQFEGGIRVPLLVKWPARPDKQWLFNLAEDPTEHNNLATARPDKLGELLALLDTHQRKSRTPLYPASVEIPVAIDKTLAEYFEKGDEYIYWPN